MVCLLPEMLAKLMIGICMNVRKTVLLGAFAVYNG